MTPAVSDTYVLTIYMYNMYESALEGEQQGPIA
jgi:hypothetical protein